jgi:hypothetical protein
MVSSDQWKWGAVVCSFTMLFGAAVIELIALMLILQGQHLVSTDAIVWTGSPFTDVQAMVDVTSISTYGVETLCGYYLLLTMAIGAAWILVRLATCGEKKRNWGNIMGYAAVALVGFFGTQVPGSPPRRTSNPFFIWSISDSITGPIHLAAAAVFLFVPLLCTLWTLFREKRWLWFGVYILLLIINAGYGIANLTVDSLDTLSGGTRVALETVSFGGSWSVYSLHEIVELGESDDGYAPLQPYPFPGGFGLPFNKKSRSMAV